MANGFERTAAEFGGEVAAVLGDDYEPCALARAVATNSSLLERRARLIVHLVRGWTDLDSLDGAKVLDVGTGFGGIALYLAAVERARVIGVDTKTERLDAGRRLAAKHQLDVELLRDDMRELRGLPEASFDLVIMNNSFCYLLDRGARAQALARLHALLRPGGWLVKRDPNRGHPLDPFTRLPLIHLLPPRAAVRAAGSLGRKRSASRLTTARAARRELIAAGFANVTSVSRLQTGAERRAEFVLGRYHHLVAQRSTGPSAL